MTCHTTEKKCRMILDTAKQVRIVVVERGRATDEIQRMGIEAGITHVKRGKILSAAKQSSGSPLALLTSSPRRIKLMSAWRKRSPAFLSLPPTQHAQ
jgi:hypothetical protein